ncbi:thioredoxin family protein [Anaerostipes sp. MSJ-23]|uniref:thioredoxin family protein n=1 Tax=unclassified Anaerostipes TaxID=2635253 RepID=UPI001C1048D8|nr:thioredoxin family protein [Anaerostipes sp. MSJ-23]MBU5459284.1 thioredoxin family protein [Anaerostipes sp. MSJ-23]
MIKELDQKTLKEVLEENKIVIVEFYSKTCSHCRKQEAGIEELSEEETGVFFGKVEIPKEIALAEEYDVTSLPTLLYFKEGKIREKSIGFTHKLIVAENIKKL